MRDNCITINWSNLIFLPCKEDIQSISFTSQVDEYSLYQLIDYLNLNGHCNFNDSFYIRFISALQLKSSSLHVPLSSFLERIQLPQSIVSEYSLKLFESCIHDPSSHQIIEFFLFNECAQDSNPIKTNPQRLFELVNKKLKGLNISIMEIHDGYTGNVSDSLISTIELFVNFYCGESKHYHYNESLKTCETIIQYLFCKLISISNVSIEKLIHIHKLISSNNIIINHYQYHSMYYLSKKSPTLIIYLMKLFKLHQPPFKYEEKEEIHEFECTNLDADIFTFNFIFQSTYDKILIKIIDLCKTVSPFNYLINHKQYKAIGTNVDDDYCSKTTNFNLEFLLSISRFDLFFKLLDSIQIVNGRIVYFDRNVYYKSIEVMDVHQFKKFIKFCSYHSFIQFLYSYNINIKYLFKHYHLINHVLLNHNHHFTNTFQIKENINFISSFWDKIFKFKQLKQTTISQYQYFIKSNVTPPCPILNQLLSIYKSVYYEEYYHYDYKHNKESCLVRKKGDKKYDKEYN